MKKNRIILIVLILSIITSIFSSCSTSTAPNIPDNGTTGQEILTPGGMAYIHYGWPTPLPAYWDNNHIGFYNFDIFLTIDVSPGVEGYYFWAHQFHFNQGNGGYIGLQTNGSIQSQQVGKMAIFSIWDALGAEPGAGASSEQFTGEGEGWSCRIPYEWEEGRTYRLRIWELCCAHEPWKDEWWAAWIMDTSTNQETFIGKIKVPAFWQWLDENSVAWVEYYGQVNGCDYIPYANACFKQPSADDGSFIPEKLTTEIGTTCTNASITPLENQGVTFETGGSL